MNLDRQCASGERLEQYLAGRLEPALVIELETHLSDCEPCRLSLERQSAEPELWDNLRSLLGRGGSHSGHGTANGTEDVIGPTRLSVLESLAPTDDPEMLGRLGEYEISGVVGIGGMGAVLRGYDKSLRRVVAIKVMATHLAGSGPARERFQREARAAAAITHDNVIDIYGVSQGSELPYLVMPFARGPSLQKRIDQSGPLTAVEVIRIGRQIAAGLAAAHEQGLVHRDIKPANILLNEGIERLLITDFGVARAMDDVSMTSTGVIAGTPQYMSPEQARGETVDHRSDLFSLGSVLYTACTGRPPFRSEAAYGILRRITDSEPRPIREINPDIPPWLCQIIDRLMAKHPANRFQTAAEVAELFEGCLAHVQQPTITALPSALTEQRSERNSIRSLSEQVVAETSNQTKSPTVKRMIGVILTSCFSFVAGLAALHFTAAPDIAGEWAGESWRSVSLSRVKEVDGWFSGVLRDSEGREGAIQLEWSRLQRRYNGRWKIGNGESGTITLRAIDGGVRGAIALDPESLIANDTPRLRDFVWKGMPSESTDNKTQPGVSPEPIRVVATEMGRITRWGETVSEGGIVRAGDLIAEITADDADLSRLDNQINLAERQLESAKKMYSLLLALMESAKQRVSSLAAQEQSEREGKTDTVKASMKRVAETRAKFEAAEANVKAQQSLVAVMQVNYERKKVSYQNGLITVAELNESEAKLKESNVNLEQAQASMARTESALRAMESQVNTVERDAQKAVNIASAKKSEAEGDLQRILLQVTSAESAMAELERAIDESQLKKDRVTRIQVSAPVTGHLSRITGSLVVDKGDILCVLIPINEGPRENRNESQQSLNSSNGEEVPDRRVPSLAAVSESPLARKLDDALRCARQLRSLRGKNDSHSRGSKEKSSIQDRNAGMELNELQEELYVRKSILRSEIKAAQELFESHRKVLQQVENQFQFGAVSQLDVLHARVDLLKSTRELDERRFLLEFYSNIESRTAAEDSKEIIGNLEARIADCDAETELHETLVIHLSAAFQAGQNVHTELVDGQRMLTSIRSRAEQLRVLLEYLKRHATSDAEPTKSSQDVEPKPVTRSRR